MRFVVTVLLALIPVTLFAGELKIKLDSMSKTCVGDELTVYVTAEDFNATYAVHDVVTTVRVKSGAITLCTKAMPAITLNPLEKKAQTVVTGWFPIATGNYNVEVTCDGSDDINGPVTDSKVLTVCAPQPCPDRPTASGNVIYLGTGTTGSVQYSSPKPECCYEIKLTIVTGRDAITARSPESWTKVPPSADVSVTVDRAKFTDGYVVVRLDWRMCDKSKSGSDYILVRDGTQPSASASTTQPPGTTAGQTPQAGVGGDPVLTSNREFVHTVKAVDVITASEIDISLRRDFRSLLSATVPQDHDFGPGWTHNYDWYAVRGDGEIYVHGIAGFRSRFRQTGNTWILDWPKDNDYQISTPGDSIIVFKGPDQAIYGFSNSGALSFVGNSYGYRNTVNYTGRWMSSITTPSGRGIVFTRDTNGYILAASDGVRNVQYDYTAGLLTGFTNGAGNKTTYSYAAGTNFLTKWTTPEGRSPFTNTYDGTGHVTSQDFGDGFTIGYSKTNDVTTLTYPLGVTFQHKHNSLSQLLEITPPQGSAATFGYDSDGNRTTIKDFSGNSYQRAFTNGLPTGSTLPNGAHWNVEYNTRSYLGLTFKDVESISLDGGLSYSFDRNPNGTISSSTTPDGKTTHYEYGTGHLPIRIRGFGTDNTYSYTPDGLIDSRTSNGTTWNFVRNVAGDVTEVKKGNETSLTLNYDLNGDVTWFDNGGLKWYYEYDKDRNTTRSIDYENRIWQWIRDSRNRVIEYRNPLETSVKYSWTGPILTTLDFPGGEKYTITPNAMGWPTSVTNKVGETWTIKSNYEGTPLEMILPGGASWKYTADGMGNITEFTSPSGKSSGAEYGKDGIQIGYHNMFGFDYTASNTFTSGVQAGVNGLTNHPSYDLRFESRYPSESQYQFKVSDEYERDWMLELNPSIDFNKYTSPLGSSVLFKGSGWRPSEIDWGFGNKMTFSRSGNTSTITFGSETLSYQYNNMGEITNANGDAITRDGAGLITTINGVSATRGYSSRITGYQFDQMPVVNFSYNNTGRVFEVTDRLGGKTTVTTSPSGAITDIEYPDDWSVHYDWTPEFQISKVSTSYGWSMQYERDGDGRVTSIIRSDDVPLNTQMNDYTLSYNWDNKIEGATYDGTSNLTKYGSIGTELSFGGFGLKGLKVGSVDWTYAADAYQYPKSATNGAITLGVTYNYLTTNPSVIHTTGPNGSWDYATLPNGRPLYAFNDQGERKYFIDDGQGNVVVTRNSDGTTYGSQAYTPYGEIAGSTGEQWVLGYKGLTGALSFDPIGYNILYANNVYRPDIGRLANRVGVMYGLPRDLDPLGENQQMLTNPFMGMFGSPTLSMGDYYFQGCAVDRLSLDPQKRERLTPRFNIDLWNVLGEGGGRNNRMDREASDWLRNFDMNLVGDVLGEGYARPQQTDELGDVARKYKINIGWDPCYGYEYIKFDFEQALKLIFGEVPQIATDDRPIGLVAPLFGGDPVELMWDEDLLEDFLFFMGGPRPENVQPKPTPKPAPQTQTPKAK